MIFDIAPKENIRDLYDRKEKLSLLASSIRSDERLILIYGARRVGKTSLMRTFLKSGQMPFISIDLKEIFFSHGSVPATALYGTIAREFANTARSLCSAQVALNENASLSDLLRAIDDCAGAAGTKIIIAIDEAQYLRFSGKVRYDGIIAWALDNLRNICFIMTGSESGILREFMSGEDESTPLFGRFRREITLQRFRREESIGFLKSGFADAGMHMADGEIGEAVDRLDGVVGWLTYYGHFRSGARMSHLDAVRMVMDEGARITTAELDSSISKSRNRYVHILKAIASGLDTWSVIKAYVISNTGVISDTVLNSLMRTLVRIGTVEKSESGRYRVADPVAAEAISRMKAKEGVP